MNSRSCTNPLGTRELVHIYVISKFQCVDVGLVYDLGGQVLAANSAPSIFHLAKEIGAETEEMDSHKFALVDSSTGALTEMKLAEDYVSMISLTLKLQVKNIIKFYLSLTFFDSVLSCSVSCFFRIRPKNPVR